MEAWERQYAKLVNNKWQTRGGQDDDHDLDEDELYLLEEKQKKLSEGGHYQCPHCEVVNDFDPHDLHCNDCGWEADGDLRWNEDRCAA